MNNLSLVIRFVLVVVAIGAIVWLEVLYRQFKIKLFIRLAGRINYPIWITLVLQHFDGLHWLIWFQTAYCGILGLLALRFCNETIFVASAHRDFLELRRELLLMQAQAKLAQERRNLLAKHGCPLGFTCSAMGGDGRDCDNFDQCNGMHIFAIDPAQET